MRDSDSRVKRSNGADSLSLLHRTGLNLFVASVEYELRHTVGFCRYILLIVCYYLWNVNLSIVKRVNGLCAGTQQFCPPV